MNDKHMDHGVEEELERLNTIPDPRFDHPYPTLLHVAQWELASTAAMRLLDDLILYKVVNAPPPGDQEPYDDLLSKLIGIMAKWIDEERLDEQGF